MSLSLVELDAPPSSVVTAWLVDLAQPAAVADRLAETLDADQRARALRLRDEAARRRFAVCHGSVRLILARTAGVSARELRFERGPHGKPRLAGARRWPAFSLSHSNDLALVVVSESGREVGADLERARSVAEAATIARRWFDAEEARRIEALEPPSRDAAFLEAWTLREAYLKARGEGLGGLAGARAVSWGSARPALALAVDAAGTPWSARQLWIDERFAAAIVAQGPSWELRFGSPATLDAPIRSFNALPRPAPASR